MKQEKLLIVLAILFFGINLFTQSVGWETKGEGLGETQITDTDENGGNGGGGDYWSTKQEGKKLDPFYCDKLRGFYPFRYLNVGVVYHCKAGGVSCTPIKCNA